MKNVSIFVLTVLLVQLSLSQTMTVHKKDQTSVAFQLSLIDSITFTSEPAISLSGRRFRGLAYHSGFLWAIHSAADVSDTVRIAKINPSTGQTVLQSAELPWNGRGITVGEGGLWITDALTDVVRKIDTTNFNQLSSFFTPTSEPSGIAFDGMNLWLTDVHSSQHIYWMSTSGGIGFSFPIPNLFRSGLEWEGNGMWTNTDSATVSFYTTNGTITGTRILQVVPSGNVIYDIAIGDNKVYVSSGDKIYIQDWTP